MAVVAFTACAAIVVTPAAIVLLGGRLDSWDVRRLMRRILRRPEPHPRRSGVVLVLPEASSLSLVDLDSYAGALSRVPGVSSASSPRSTFVDGRPQPGPPSSASGLRDGSAFLTVTTTAPLYSTASTVQLDRLHAVPTPAGKPVQLPGAAQGNRDSVHAISSRLPWVLTIIAMITMARCCR